MNLPPELKIRIHKHIEAVQRNLDGLPADEEREILQSLEIHIHDALEARSNGNPGSDILEAIIAEMDPPESYGSAPLIAPRKSDSKNSGRKTWFFVLIGILFFFFAFIWLNDPFSSQWMSGQLDLNQLIQEGTGVNGFTLGMDRETLIQKHGQPQSNHPDWLMNWDTNPQVDVVITEEGICREVRFNHGFEGATVHGIGLGSSFQEMISAYGTAELVWTSDGCVIAEWPSMGIAFWTSNVTVTQIIVREPQQQVQTAFKDDPPVLGHWKSIDFVKDINQFNPAHRNWDDELFLKELTFLPDGTSSNHWKWTHGRILNKTTQSRYELKTIRDIPYLFMEWMSGDVTEQGSFPCYYVFTKD